MQIKEMKARKIANSRGEETIEIFIDTKKGRVFASAPSGKSRGKYEAEPFSSKGIDFSISFANAMGKKLISEKMSFSSFEDLKKFEKIIKGYDKTKNWSLIGGNTVFAMESALLKSAALENEQELWQFLDAKAKSLPFPVGNCIGGGVHVKNDRKPDIQEFLLIPHAKNFYDSYFINLQAYKNAKQELLKKDEIWRGEMTDENAFASSLKTEEILELLTGISLQIKEKFKVNLKIGMDVAASTLFDGTNYLYKSPKKTRKTEEQIDFILSLIKDYNLFYVEDPLHEDDFEGFSKITKSAKKCLIVGDDLTATHSERLQKAIENKSVNAVIAKPNQNGSLIETKEFVQLAQKNKITTIISHRSGETSDATIADLAVAWNIPYIKTGILGKERFAKLNRLLKIERMIRK